MNKKNALGLLFAAFIVLFAQAGSGMSWYSDWGYRQNITLVNNDPSRVMREGYVANITINASQLISEGKLAANLSDLRIIFRDTYSLNWINLTPIFPGQNLTIYFRTQSNISASTTDRNYSIYYGKSNPGNTLNNGSAIWDFFDSFWDKEYTADPSWKISNGNWNASTGYLVGSGSAIADISSMWPANTSFNWDTGNETFIGEWDAMYDGDGDSYFGFLANGVDIGGDPTADCYNFEMNGATGMKLYRWDNGGLGFSVLVNGGIPNVGQWYRIRVTRVENGTWELFVNGTSKGTAVDTTYSNMSILANLHTAIAPGQGLDNITLSSVFMPRYPKTTIGGEEIGVGLNVYVYYNDTGLPAVDWYINFTNSTNTMAFFNRTTPAFFYYSTITLGNTNLTITDGSATLYYYNFNTSININETMGTINLSASLRKKTDNTLTFSVIPQGSATYGTPIIATCSSLVGSPTMRRNGEIITSPDVFVGASGTYNYTCESVETNDYAPVFDDILVSIVGTSSACTSNTTFAFRFSTPVSGTLITLDFTSLIASNFTKPDMRDIYSTAPIFRNTTHVAGQNWLTFNITGLSTLNVSFGNYVAYVTQTVNATLPPSNLTNASTTSTINPYYIFIVFDEISGVVQLPPLINESEMTISCMNGSTTFNFNDTKFLVPTFSIGSDVLVNVFYTGLYTSYSRNYLIDDTVEYIPIYLVDATTYTLYQVVFNMLSFKFYDSKIHILKDGQSGEITITEGKFDFGHDFNTYLIKDNKYKIRIVDPVEGTRDIGFFVPIAAGTQDISIAEITLEPKVTLISNAIQISGAVNSSTNILRLYYSDSTEGTQSLTFKVYENANQTPFWENTYYDTNSITITIPGINASSRFSVVWSIEHDTFGNSPVEGVFALGAFGALAYLGPGIAPWVYQAIAFTITTLGALVITPRIRLGGTIFMGAMLGLWFYINWFSSSLFNQGMIALIIVLFGLSVVYEFKRRGME